MIPINWSRYPNKYEIKHLNYSKVLFNDSTLFKEQKGDYLYEVLDINVEDIKFDSSLFDKNDIMSLYKLKLISDKLMPDGKEQLSKYMNEDWQSWREIQFSELSSCIHPDFLLLPTYMVKDGDSLHFLTGFVGLKAQRYNYDGFIKVNSDSMEKHVSFELELDSKTSQWKIGDLIFAKKSILMKDATDLNFEIGLSTKYQKLCPVYKGVIK